MQGLSVPHPPINLPLLKLTHSLSDTALAAELLQVCQTACATVAVDAVQLCGAADPPCMTQVRQRGSLHNSRSLGAPAGVQAPCFALAGAGMHVFARVLCFSVFVRHNIEPLACSCGMHQRLICQPSCAVPVCCIACRPRPALHCDITDDMSG